MLTYESNYIAVNDNIWLGNNVFDFSLEMIGLIKMAHRLLVCILRIYIIHTNTLHVG
jgi:hypothetical protein